MKPYGTYLQNSGGPRLLDFREGDRFLDRLYRGIRAEKFQEDPDTVAVPEQFNFIVMMQGGSTE